MKSKTCCFTGHRKIPGDELPQIKTKLKNTIIELINNGVIYYGAGGALGFDTLAAKARDTLYCVTEKNNPILISFAVYNRKTY